MKIITQITKQTLLVLLILSFIFIQDNNRLINTNFFPSNLSDELSFTPETKDSMWREISREFKLDHNTQSYAVQAEIKKLLADKTSLYQILQQAGPYLYYIHSQVKQRGLPSELALIPFVESEYNPNDRSNKGATGIWQLMAQTARELGVKVIGNYDGRRNITASTRAALAYFKDLGTMFNGNWYLAIAAYNCGQGRVFSAQKKTGSKNFWTLPLPKETKLYVPKLLAIAAIVNNPEKYGVELPPIDNQPFFTELEVNNKVDLDHLSKSTNIDIKTLKKLNPDYNHPVIPKAKTNTYSLLIPTATTDVVGNHVSISKVI